MTVINSAPAITSYNASSLNRTYVETDQDVAFKENETVRFAVGVTDADINDNLSYAWLLDSVWKAATVFWDWGTGWFTGNVVHNVTAYVSDGTNTTHNSWNVFIQNIVNQFWSVGFASPTPANGENLGVREVNVSIDVTPTPTEPAESLTVFHANGSSFDGIHNLTEYNSTNGSLQLVSGNLVGDYTSQVYDAGKNTQWQTLRWDAVVPNGGELNVQSNMMALWAMDEPSWNANVKVTDSTGNGNNGTAHNQANTTSDAKFVRAGTFDGVGDYVQIDSPNLPLGNQSRTVEGWIKTDGTTGTANEARGILSYGSSVSGGYVGFAIEEGVLYVSFDNACESGIYLKGSKRVDDSSWHHVAFTYESNGSLVMYVDGQVDGTDVISGVNTTQATSTYFKRIGYYYGCNDRDFKGEIDDLAVWNQTLSSQVIQTHYAAKTSSLKFRARTCDDSACAGEQFTGPTGASTYYTDSTGSGLGNLQNNRWFQYKAYFESNDYSYTPQLHNATAQATKLAVVPGIDMSSAWVQWNNVNYTMSGSGYTWSRKFSNLVVGQYTFTAYANDTYGNVNYTETRTVTVPSYNITFNVTSGEDGTALNNVQITCDYTGFNQAGDTSNTYGPYQYPTGTWQCEFTLGGFYTRAQTFIANGDKYVQVTLDEKFSLTNQEHDWLREVYECVVGGDCTAYRMWSSTNATVSKIWNEYLPTDSSVVLQEDNISSTLSSAQNITYNYTLRIPFKEGYANGDMLPVRIFYWFTDADNKCYSQDKQSDANNAASPYCVPLVATYLGPNNGTVSFTVDLRPNLPAGSYRVVRQIDIDPVENGEPVWLTYGRNVIGTIKVLGGDSSSNVAEEKGVVSNSGQTVARSLRDIGNQITGGVVKDVVGQNSFALGMLLAFLIVSVAANAYIVIRRKKK